MNNKISVLLLTQNSQKSIKRCLDSLVKFDEVIIIDGGSTDNTITIANSYNNVKIFNNKWDGFINQRNFSLTKAKHDWCFMIDSDEKCNNDLADELIKISNQENDKNVMYCITRTEYYCGKTLESGFGASSLQERFFKKSCITYTGGVHHKHLYKNEPLENYPSLIGKIENKFRIEHDPNFSLEQWIKKLPRFSLYIAEEKSKNGKTYSKTIILISLIFTFFQIYLKSYKNKEVGFIISIQEAIYRTLVKLIVYEKSINKSQDKTNIFDQNLQ